MKKPFVLAVAAVSAAAVQAHVLDDAKAWYRGAADGAGDGVFTDGRGCFRDVLHAADATHANHAVRNAAKTGEGVPIRVESLRVHCPYRNETLEDFPCLTFPVPVETKKFGRIAAQAAKQVVIQGIREAERGIIYEEFTSKEHEILTGIVSHIEPRTGSVSIRISSNSEFTEAMLAPNERIKTEELKEGDRIKVYVVEVRNSTRGPQVLISRTHPGLVKRLFELEVPEIYDGTVEIKSIAREAGSRTKMAVWSADPDVDPIGSCVGPKGGRVASIVNELGGEKIDIVKYSEVPEEYIAAALSPSEVVSVTMLEDGKSCRVIVPDSQLSLAIGKEGQNARLAAKLTGYKIDIKPESES